MCTGLLKKYYQGDFMFTVYVYRKLGKVIKSEAKKKRSFFRR